MINEPTDDLLIPALQVSAVSAAQVLIFVLLYEAAVEIYKGNFGEMNKIFGFGMQMNYGLSLLSILAGVHGLAQVLLARVQHKLIATLLCSVIWITYWGNISDVVPNRVGLLSVLGMLSFLVGAVLHSRRVDPSFS